MTFFRLTPEEYERIKKFQENHQVFRLLLGKQLNVDHHHESGMLRGLLEFRLNKGYGLIEKAAKENTANVLRALAEFVDHPPAVTVLGERRYGVINEARHKKSGMYYGGPQDEPERPHIKCPCWKTGKFKRVEGCKHHPWDM